MVDEGWELGLGDQSRKAASAAARALAAAGFSVDVADPRDFLTVCLDRGMAQSFAAFLRVALQSGELSEGVSEWGASAGLEDVETWLADWRAPGSGGWGVGSPPLGTSAAWALVQDAGSSERVVRAMREVLDKCGIQSVLIDHRDRYIRYLDAGSVEIDEQCLRAALNAGGWSDSDTLLANDLLDGYGAWLSRNKGWKGCWWFPKYVLHQIRVPIRRGLRRLGW